MKKEIKWKYEIGQRIIDYNEDGNIKRDLTISDRKMTNKQIKDKRKKRGYTNQNIKLYKYKCNMCGFECNEHYSLKESAYMNEYWIGERNLFNNKSGCYCCGKGNQIVVKGINDIATTNPELIKYFVNVEDAYKYSYTSNKRVLTKCLNCGIEKKTPLSTLYIYGFSCPKCSDGISYPNKFMFNLLQQLNTSFETEKRFDWCKYKINNKESYGIYDFYIPSMKLIIEMDGGFHKRDNKMSGQTAEETQGIDSEKDRLAKENGLEVVRIDCNYGNGNRFDYIKNSILDNKLNEIFNLDTINWENVIKYSEKSLIKEVSEYWRTHNEINNENLITANLAEYFNLTSACIIKYLKCGSKLKWCSYDSKQERIKSIQKVGFKNGKKIKCIETGDVFNSSQDCENKSEELFGVKLTRSLINAVCNGTRNHHHNLHFKFI